MARSRATAAAAALLRRARGGSEAASEGLVPLFDLKHAGAGSGSRLFSSLAARSAATVAGSPAFLSGAWSPTGAAPATVPFGARAISTEALQASDTFEPRHNGANYDQGAAMLAGSPFSTVEELITATVPADIVREDGMCLGELYNDGMTESEFLAFFKEMAELNTGHKKRNFLGMGYYGTHLPTVVQRNVLENPGWYTQYTPYQAEISQGRLESLLNFQTMVADLTGMELSNASLLDEATAAAEAMTMCSAIARGKKTKFLVSSKCHPQTVAVCQTRADGLGLEVVVADEADFDYSGNDVCGVLVQYPDTTGAVTDYKALTEAAHAAKVKVCAATDLLALTMLTPPGEWGADIVVGCAQRFGVPMGYGGPHAAFLATSSEYKRLLPGRIIGMSVDAEGNPALRMAMQTREQHIRRDKATSNICTAQALLANISACYGVYHGPEGLKKIAARVNGLAHIFAAGAAQLGATTPSAPFFDTVTIGVADAAAVQKTALEHDINLRVMSPTSISVAFDETHTPADVDALFAVLNGGAAPAFTCESLAESVDAGVGEFKRETSFMTHPVFTRFHDEHGMLRYLKTLENKDLSLVHSMIPLGSCTMKLNSTTEMIPVTWPELANVHPFVPPEQAQGYAKMFDDLSAQLSSITGFDAMSLQPNSGASGEYAGLMAIRAYHQSRGEGHRNICIIPTSAHGTNPASAVMCGMKIVAVPTVADGSIDMDALTSAIEKHRDNLAAFMITYPSTFGVFDEGIKGVCEMIHEAGGQVYMDGANMNAQVGLTSPGHIGADVCHLNLHKTFCIPHGGGGPGMGPIGIKEHLKPFMPTHPVIPTGSLPPVEGGDAQSFGAMAAAPFGSSLILPISYAYISMMGSAGLKKASEVAILNANYMMNRLEGHFNVLFKGKNGTCAHEFIIDLRPFKESAGIEAEDVAKRLIDYGFHSPTMSWPVTGTLMIEPTESEPLAELDRFCNAMIAIREEIAEIEAGNVSKDSNLLKHAPHTQHAIVSEEWDRPYTREKAAFPAAWVRNNKFWPTTARVDNVLGDRVLKPRLVDAAVEAKAETA